MPPDQAFQNMSADQFNNSEQWIFVETAKFSVGCDAKVAPKQQVPVLLRTTKWVTALQFVDGIAVIVLPGYIIGPWIDIQIGFYPWPAWYFVDIIFNLNFVWQNTLIINVNVACTP